MIRGVGRARMKSTIEASISSMNRFRAAPIVGLAFLLGVSAPVGAGPVRSISAEDWSRPRDGNWISRLPALVATVQDHLQSPERRIRIRYAGGEEGEIWAEELRSWLIALGIEGRRIELLPGAQRVDQIELSVGP